MIAAALCLAEGTSMLTEGVWASRYRYTEEFRRLGAQIQVPTLDGKVTYTIPEGTQTGKEFVIRDKGIPEVNNPRRRGSHRFTVVVETPTRLTKEQRELLRQLEETMEETPKRKKFFKILKDLFD